MRTNNCHPSTCSNCKFFNPEGHISGDCSQLHVTVNGEWQSCSLGTPAFSSIAELLVQIELKCPTDRIQDYVTNITTQPKIAQRS